MKLLIVQILIFCALNLVYGEHFKIIPRAEWKAEPPKGAISDFKLPVHNIVIAHTDTEECHTKEDCIYRIKRIQHIHMKRFDDIAYNFLIGGDGNVYEGRGWKKVGAHTKHYNSISIGVAFVGKFQSVSPTTKQLDSAKSLIAEGLKHKEIATDYKLYGQRTLTETQSPGTHLFQIIKKWPHFTDKRPHKLFYF